MKCKKLAVIMGLSLALGTMACTAMAEEITDEITVWTRLTQEEIDNYITDFNAVNPNIKVNAVVFPADTYTTKLEAAFRTGAGAPDVFLSEVRDLGKFKETAYLEDLSGEPYNASEIIDDFVPYVAELCKDSEGAIKGLSYQSCPGGFWYYKPLAKEYLGTDDPDELQAMLGDWETYAEKGAEVYEKSGGAVALFDSARSITVAMFGAKEAPHVSDGKLLPVSFYQDVLETAQMIDENHGDAQLEQWDATWSASFYGDNKFIMFGIPSWGLHYCIKANTPADATDTDNTWGFIQAPEAYKDGGTWLSMYSGSEHKEAAWEFIRTITSDLDYLKLYVDRTGDMIGYIPGIEMVIENGFRDPFTGDQNIYQYMYDAAMNVKPIAMTPYDQQIEDDFHDKQKLALAGEMTVEEAMQAFKDEITTQFPEIVIE